MSIVEVFALSAALGADLFSVAIPIGMTKLNWLRTVKSSLVFALFHIGMILAGHYIGNWLGSSVEQLGEQYVHNRVLIVENLAKITGASVLTLLGAYMLWEKLSNNTSAIDRKCATPTHPLEGIALITLAISVSIDALAAGLSLGMIDVDLFKLSAILGAVIFIISFTGLSLGSRLSKHTGSKAGVIGAIVLILLGLRVLWTLV